MKKAAELNAQKQADLKEKEQVARVKQILEHHNQAEISGDVTFNFTFENKIKDLDVNEVTHKQLVKGLLAICYLEGKFYVLPDEPARKSLRLMKNILCCTLFLILTKRTTMTLT